LDELKQAGIGSDHPAAVGMHEDWTLLVTRLWVDDGDVDVSAPAGPGMRLSIGCGKARVTAAERAFSEPR
jgi:hypothetical protein